jgi:hypothetical protein
VRNRPWAWVARQVPLSPDKERGYLCQASNELKLLYARFPLFTSLGLALNSYSLSIRRNEIIFVNSHRRSACRCCWTGNLTQAP